MRSGYDPTRGRFSDKIMRQKMGMMPKSNG